MLGHAQLDLAKLKLKTKSDKDKHVTSPQRIRTQHNCC